jgi:hypothetical protein
MTLADSFAKMWIPATSFPNLKETSSVKNHNFPFSPAIKTVSPQDEDTRNSRNTKIRY